MFMPIVGTFLCEVSIVTYVSRILFAYSRDKAVPFSSFWVVLQPVSKLPLRAVRGAACCRLLQEPDRHTRRALPAWPQVWGTVFAALLFGLAFLRSTAAVNAVLSLSVIALNVAYVTPSVLRCTVGRKRFRPGPFSMGVWIYPATVRRRAAAAAIPLLRAQPSPCRRGRVSGTAAPTRGPPCLSHQPRAVPARPAPLAVRS